MNKHIIGSIILVTIFCWNYSLSQSVLQNLKNDKRTSADKELIMEMSELFQKVLDSCKVDFNHADTLFTIHGISIESRQGFGYVWNNVLKTAYNDNKIYKHHKLINSNPKLRIKSDKETWYEFEGLIPIIDKWDTLGIINYINNSDMVLGSIHLWNIFRFVKEDKNYHFDFITVREFGKYRKQ